MDSTKTYWASNGKYQAQYKQVNAMIKSITDGSGEFEIRPLNCPHLERMRAIAWIYYDIYNNGAINDNVFQSANKTLAPILQSLKQDEDFRDFVEYLEAAAKGNLVILTANQTLNDPDWVDDLEPEDDEYNYYHRDRVVIRHEEIAEPLEAVTDVLILKAWQAHFS